MTKLYAVIKPAFTFSGDGFADMPYLIVAPLHKAMYERVCGYSLGHGLEFYSTLEDAKKGFEIAVAASKYAHFFTRCVVQNAILELKFDQDKAVSFYKIFTVTGIDKKIIKSAKNENYFEKIYVPKWEEKEITSNDVTVNALAEVNRLYSSSVQQQPSKAALK